LKYVFDELIIGSNDIVERYTWTLTYTPETPSSPNGGIIPGFSIFSLITAISLGIILIERKKKIDKFS